MIWPYFVYEITSRCTNDCIYCYNVWKDNGNNSEEELSLLEIKKLFCKLSEEITPAGVTLTGGEPLLHPDILEVASFLAYKNIRVGIATNGILLDEEMTRKLTDSGVSYFEVSLDSIDQKKYSYLTHNHKLKNVKNAILNIKKHDAELTVSFTLTKLNLDDLEETIDYCFAFSADSIALNRFVPGGSGLKNLSQLQLKTEDLKRALSIADKKSKEYNLPINVTIPIESCIIDHKQYPHLNFGVCACAKNKWVIDFSGNLRTCEQNSEVLGSLFDNGFLELAQSKAVKLFRQNNFKNDCNKCEQFSHCGGGCRFLHN